MRSLNPDQAALKDRLRIEALEAFDLLDTPAEADLDAITRLAAAVLGAASAGISLIDAERQWFKSRQGIPFDQTPRDVALCAHAVTSCETLVIPDARLDPRFADNPLVTKPGGIRFYVGAPLVVASGHCLGALCAFDPTPRDGLTEHQTRTFEMLARLAVDLIETRRERRMGEIAAKVVEATSDAVLAVDLDGRIVYWNPAAARMFGRAAPDVLGQGLDVLMPSRLTAGKSARLLRAALTGDTRVASTAVELTAVRSDSAEFPVELSLAPWSGEAGGRGFAAIIRDVSERKALERERAHAKAFLDSVVSNLPAMLFVKDAETRTYVMINKAGEEVTGLKAAEMIGSSDRALFPEHGEAFERRDIEAVESGETHVFESYFVRDDGATARLRTTRILIDGPDRPDQYILGITEDMTPTRKAEAEAQHLSRYDALTGLINRANAAGRLHRLVQSGAAFGMLSVDLARFRTVNDQWGQSAGDAVLLQCAERLRAIAGPADWIARVGGDEFAVAVLGGDVRERARSMADAAAVSLAEPFHTDWGDAHLGVAVGGVIAPEDGSTSEVLRENVDLALHRAKIANTGQPCFFSPQMDAEARDRRKLESDLRHAVAEGQIGLVYQPLVSAETGRITSAEALARWTHPTRGPIRPDVFISIAEEAGLIGLLGEQILRQACADAQTWPHAIRVAVNLSPLQFASDRLVETVQDALAVSGLAPDRLQLEVTEGLVIRDVDRTFRQLEALRALGIQVLIDDFGVGYSSLSYFQRFPFDKVKIDKSFVDDVATSRAAKAIIGAVIGLGRALDMGVVAEGVETEEQRDILAAMGCTHLQGYLFSPPIPGAAILTLLSASTAGRIDRAARSA